MPSTFTATLQYSGTNVISGGVLFVKPKDSDNIRLEITYSLPSGYIVTGMTITEHPSGGNGLTYVIPTNNKNKLVVYDSGQFTGEYQFNILFKKGTLNFKSDPTIYNSGGGS